MCKNCKSKPVYEFTNQRKLCKNCFIEWFQKKVLYIIRKFGMIQKKDVVGYISDTHQVGLKEGRTPKNIQKNIFTKGKDFRDVVLEDVLKMFVGKADVELVKLRSQVRGIDKKENISKVARGQTIDLTACKIIDSFINKNVKALEGLVPTEGKIIKPLYLFLDKEVLLYAKIKKLKFKKDKEKTSEISKFIDELEIKHPEVKRAIVNGWLKVCD